MSSEPLEFFRGNSQTVHPEQSVAPFGLTPKEMEVWQRRVQGLPLEGIDQDVFALLRALHRLRVKAAAALGLPLRAETAPVPPESENKPSVEREMLKAEEVAEIMECNKSTLGDLLYRLPPDLLPDYAHANARRVVWYWYEDELVEWITKAKKWKAENPRVPRMKGAERLRHIENLFSHLDETPQSLVVLAIKSNSSIRLVKDLLVSLIDAGRALRVEAQDNHPSGWARVKAAPETSDGE